MNDIPLKYKEKVDTYQPIDFEGITLYPIKVRSYALFQDARPAIEFLQQSLPVRYLSMPLISAYFAMDVENLNAGKPTDGLFARTLVFLILSLRLYEGMELGESLSEIAKGILVDSKDPSKLKEIWFVQDGEEKHITPVQFHRMRPVLAAQNGIELESTDVNPELAEAERDIAEQSGPELDHDLASLISSVAAFSGVEEAELYDWPIIKLFRRKDSYERVLSYLVCGIATAQGAKFKGGNPVPSPFFARKDKDGGALIDMAAFTKGNKVSVSDTAPV